jgi:hypothetical protein
MGATVKYSLIKQSKGSDHDYLDQGGISWSSPENWFFIGILGGCGCGNSEEFAKKGLELLRFFGSEERTENPVNKSELTELLAHWFDDKGLIEHGTIISSSWLTDKGKAILDALNKSQDARL